MLVGLCPNPICSASCRCRRRVCSKHFYNKKDSLGFFHEGRILEPQESSLSRFLTLSFEDSAEKFFTYTKHGFPCPRRFRSIKPNFSSSRSSRVALLSAQRKVLLTSSIVKMMNTRPFLSNHSFLTERLIRSSRMPYRVFASVDRSWNCCSWKRVFGMRKNEKSSPACP